MSTTPNGAIYHFHYKPRHPNSNDPLDRVYPIRTWNIVVHILSEMHVETPKGTKEDRKRR